jgi:ketosteroid isomerase-like protein
LAIVMLLLVFGLAGHHCRMTPARLAHLEPRQELQVDLRGNEEHIMSDSSFDSFMQRRRRVAAAFVNGDPGPLREISTSEDPATIFGPGGGVEQGAARVLATNDAASRQFHGGTTDIEVLHSRACGDLAYWTGWQTAAVHLDGRQQPVPMKLRVTEIFRRDGESWKLIHRHADMLAEAQPRH